MSNRAFDKELGHRIQGLRREKGYSSSKVFMERTGITEFSQATYAAIEQGSVSLSFDKAIRIADALGITLDELAGREPTKVPETKAPATVKTELSKAEVPETEHVLAVQSKEATAAEPAPRDERDLLRDYRELSAADRATVARTALALRSLGREEDAVRAEVMERLYGVQEATAKE